MKFNYFVAFLLCLFTVSAIAQRTEVSLNGTWKFMSDAKNIGETADWKTQLPQNAVEVKVPHTFNLMKGLDNYAGKAWYQRKFDVPAEWKDKSVRLIFEAVYHDATVFVNGVKVTEHFGSGYTQFSVDVTAAVKVGQPNTLVVLADNTYTELALPYKRSFDWVNDGGIIRGVKLVSAGTPSIRYAHLLTEINFADTTSVVSFGVKLYQEKLNQASFVVKATNWKTGEVLFAQDINSKKAGDEFRFTVKTPKVKLWDLFSPNLYNVTVDVKNDKTISDIYKTRIGFREIKTEGTSLMLNRKRVRLPGIEHMPGSHPDYGSAEPKWLMDSVVSMLDDLNVKVTRFHWEVDEYYIDKLDENGILLQAEIPWWQQPTRLSPEVMGIAKKHFDEMIERDFNHPSIFAWGIANEVKHDGFDDITEMKRYVKNLDSSRFVNVIANSLGYKVKDDWSVPGDILTWNEYTGTWHETGKDSLLAFKFSNIKKAFPDRPVLITEHGLCEPFFIGGDQKRITSMIYHYNEWAKQPFVIGCIYFCLSDYRTQMGEDGVGRYCARIHGITDMYLNKKSSYDVFKNLTRPIEVLKVKKLDDTTVQMELMNKDGLPSYFTEGFVMKYKLVSGEMKTVPIPAMKPGEIQNVKFENVPPRYNFKIIAPNGKVINGYPIDK